MRIVIETISHDKQRYDTCGDWHYDISNNSITIKVSKLDDWRQEFLVAFHELIETILCIHRGVTGEMVDEFDFKYEENRKDGDHSEPGDHPDAPYRQEHFFATTIERLMAAELDIDWSEYENVIDKLGE